MTRLKCRPEVFRHAVRGTSVVVILLVVAPPQTVRAVGDEAAKNLRPPSTPSNVAELKELEARLSAATRETLPAIVAVSGPNGSRTESAGFLVQPHFEDFGSGVIIRRDGLILSQWHVSHGYDNKRKPGDCAEVILQDGRRLKAEVLGADQMHDLSLLRILEAGEYPYVSLDDENIASLGDWVLKLGHPYGYRASRGAVVRLGRVLYLGDTIDIVADCLIFGGDSGGPLINLHGKVVGIVHRGGSPQATMFSPPTRRSGRPLSYKNVRTIRELMPSMLNGVVCTELDPVFREKLRNEVVGDANVLPMDFWTQGTSTLSPWRQVTRRGSGSVVEVLDDDLRVGLGTVIAACGWVLTKASELPDHPRCRLPDGEIVQAKVVGVDAAFDLAMLKIDGSGLQAVHWADETARPVGTLVAAPDGSGSPTAVGIVTVRKRKLEGPFPTAIVKAPPRNAPTPCPPEVLGKTIGVEGFRVTHVEGSAARAEIRRGDLIMSIDGHPIRQRDDLIGSINGRAVADELRVSIARNGQFVERTLILEPELYTRCASTFGKYMNFRSDNFPMVFEHDIPLALDECGGPVIDLDGKALGITIARVGQHGCMAIPADAIRPLIGRLKSNGQCK